jgi:hypothetical protein
MTAQSRELAKFIDHKMIKQAAKQSSAKALPKKDDNFDGLLERLADAEREGSTRKHH